MKKLFKVCTLMLSLFVLAACNNGTTDSGGGNNGDTETTPEPPAHTHTFATTWTSDEHGHWRAANCDHKTETKDKAAHTFVGNKCSACDYEKEVEKTAQCDIYCPICGECMDERCELDTDKCGNGNKSFEFEAEYCEWYDPAGEEPDVIGRSTQPEKGGCVFVQSLSGGNGKTLTFTITADADMTVTLRIRASKGSSKTIFTEEMTVVVNGEVLERSSTVPAYDKNKPGAANEAKRDFDYTNLGCIQLKEGENTIDVVAFSSDASVGYNMDKIELLAPQSANLTWTPIERQGS